MLTPTDIHLIAGLFSKISTPDDVDIILGEMVYDKAAKRKRDIDITIKYKNEQGKEISFIGIQVKDHTRKLGSPEVEQLCQHFKDTESINKGGIISASGFTKPAINKAKYHNIDLYELGDWEYNLNELPHLKFPKDFKLNEISNVFIDKPKIIYIFEEDLLEKSKTFFNGNSHVFYANGSEILNIKTIDELSNSFIRQVLNSKSVKADLDKAEIDEKTVIDVNVTITDNPAVLLENKLVPIKQVKINGTMQKKLNQCETHFKILVKLDDPEYKVGTAIGEMSNGLLLGLYTSSGDKSVKLMTIPISERVKEKIHQIKIK